MTDRASAAVFLSYASQDAEAAKRIGEALRAAGVEVWFDQNELVGGDAWDRKIRQQIKECALFVPVISANTDARAEGYFRLEWLLAVERSRLMSEEKAFLVPVVVDATTEAAAKVPDKFRDVQWTKLPGGEATTATFVQRVRHLLGDSTVGPVGDRAPGQRSGLPAPPVTAKPNRSALVLAVAALTMAVLGLGAYVALRPAGREASAAPKPVAEPKSAPSPITPNPSPAAPPAAKSIAVLPFENRSDEKGSEFFTDGIHDNILTSLANLGQLQVTSRTSVMEYRGTKKKIPQIARELNVAYVLEGAVQRAGNTVLITGQLIRAATDEHVWAKNYPRELTAANIFAIQSELAQAIAGELKAAISPQEKTLLARRPTENLAALDLYLKARALTRPTRENFQTRESWLQTAVGLDPTFALAWGELAMVHVGILAASFDTTPARLAKAKDAIDRAVALAPESPEVIRALGRYFDFGVGDHARASELFEQVLRLQPNDAETRLMLGAAQFFQGRWPEGIASQRTAMLLDPSNTDYVSALIRTCTQVRRFDEAIAEQRRLVALWPDRLEEAGLLAQLAFKATGSTREAEELLARLETRAPQSREVIWLRKQLATWRKDYVEYLRLDGTDPGTNRDPVAQRFSISPSDLEATEAAGVLRAQGDQDGARARLGDFPARLRAKLELEPNNTQFLRTAAIVEAILGNREEALRRIARAAEVVPEAGNAFVGVAISVVRTKVYAWSGDKDRAIDEIARLLRIPSGLNIHQLKVDPGYAPLRGDPRFEALVNDPKNNAPLY